MTVKATCWAVHTRAFQSVHPPDAQITVRRRAVEPDIRTIQLDMVLQSATFWCFGAAFGVHGTLDDKLIEDVDQDLAYGAPAREMCLDPASRALASGDAGEMTGGLPGLSQAGPTEAVIAGFEDDRVDEGRYADWTGQVLVGFGHIVEKMIINRGRGIGRHWCSQIDIVVGSREA